MNLLRQVMNTSRDLFMVHSNCKQSTRTEDYTKQKANDRPSPGEFSTFCERRGMSLLVIFNKPAMVILRWPQKPLKSAAARLYLR
jgi:hypothetical protein